MKMRKDSELFLKKVLEYREKVKKDYFVISCQALEEIPNIESVIYDIIANLIANNYITRNSHVTDNGENVKIGLTLDGINYFNDLAEDKEKSGMVFHVSGGQVNIAKDSGKINLHDTGDSNKKSRPAANVKVKLLHDNTHDIVMNKFIKRKYKDAEMSTEMFEAYSKLFQSFVCVKYDDVEEQQVDNLFQFTASKVDETDNENYIKVVGPDGTGKSTFLSLLYLYLYEKFSDKKLKHYPFYINLHYYDSNVIEAENMDELNNVIKERITEDINVLIEFSKRNPDVNFLIIIDGNEKYERTHLKSGIFLEDLLGKINNHKKIICLGEKTNIHSYRERKENIYNIDNLTTYTFHFSSIYINQKDKWENEIVKFCKIFGNEKQAYSISKCIDRFRIKEIDYNLLTIFCDVSKKINLESISSISDLYHQYCLKHFDKNEKRLNICATLCYKYFMTKEFIDQQYIAQNWKEWELVHQHKTVSNYLLALYYSKIIFEGKAENVKQFECVFTNGINTFLKTIINKTKSNQRDTLKFCRILFQENDFRIRAQAAYLVGRVEDTLLQDEAKELLRSQLKLRSVTNIPNDNKGRELLFAERSVLVSLLYLGDVSAGEILLKYFFDSLTMNEVNRAFYIQYYEDVIREPEIVNLYDDGQAQITCTISVLFNYINAELLKDELEWTTQSRNVFQIYLFTLCSLIQQRLDAKHGLSVEIEKLKSVLADTMNRLENYLEEDMRNYIIMLQEDIFNSSYSIGHLYDELYEVKDIQRRGWVEKIEQGSIQVDRYENVIEHTYYAWLLGMLYLPDQRLPGKDYKKYDKKKILNCLLIHDLAERYVGDKLPEESTGVHRENEDECMKRILRHDMYAGIGNMNAYRKAWEDFGLDSKDINGRIAKEIDIIQAIYQFCVYKEQGAQFTKAKEREWKKERYKIKTFLGRKIFKEIVYRKYKKFLD